MTQCGTIALVGAPNAGKSTLLNRLVGSKVSIVSPKVQTTRVVVTGILTEGDAQVIFVDTPGIFSPKHTHRLEKTIVDNAWRGVGDVDRVCLLVDVKKGICDNVRMIVAGLSDRCIATVLVLNKVDLVPPPSLLALTQALHDLYGFDETYMISAQKGDGVHDLQQYMLGCCPEGPWLYDEEQVSTVPLRFLAEEVTREALFYRLGDELPYSVAVETEKWEETDDAVRIHHIIYVVRESQKKIVLGKGGAVLKQVGIQARKQLSGMLDKTVHLFLFVKVKPDWLERPERFIGGDG